jgi:hypothetical protein
MTDETQDELIADAINSLTEKVSKLLLNEFLQLPDELQMNIILIKSSQLLLANVLCSVAGNRDELDKITAEQGSEMKELVDNCAFSGFADKFDIDKH